MKKLKHYILFLLLIMGIFAFPQAVSATDIIGTGSCGASSEDNLTWSLDSDGVLTISGQGDMQAYSWYNGTPWSQATGESGFLTKVIFEEGVTSIGDYAFYYENNLQAVEFADSITSIGGHAFEGCNLKSIDLPSNLETIEWYAFCDCMLLERVVFPASVKTVSSGAFSGCAALKSAVFLNPDTVLDGGPFTYSSDVTIYTTKNGAVKTAAEEEQLSFKLLSDLKISNFYLNNALGTTSATLTWDNPGLTDGYYIYKYNTSTKKYEKKYTVSANKTSYKLTGLKSGTVYQYQIKSFATLDGKTYTSTAAKIKFRTKSSSSTISAKNQKITNGYVAAVKTTTRKLSGLLTNTDSLYGGYAAYISPICQFTDNKGNYCVAYENDDYTYVYIRAYNENMKQVYWRKIKMIYPTLGTVGCDEDGYFYIVWGKRDTDEETGTVTMAISKYKKDGTLVKTYKHKTSSAGDTMYPFRSGNCDIAIRDGILVCTYCRQMYNGHQSSSTFTIDTATMKNINTYYNYVSHSFDQRVLFDKDDVAWFVDHGDAYPRGFGVATYGGAKNYDFEPFHFYAKKSALEDMSVLNRTNARLGGVVETSSGLVLVGSSVKTLKSSGYNTQKKNLFIMYADPSKKMLDGVSRSGYCLGESVTDTGVKWLTNYTGYDVENPQVVYTDDDRIVILWEKVKNTSNVTTYYMILSSNGKVLQKATKIKGVRLNTNEEPIYKDGYVFWSTAGKENYTVDNKLRIHRLNLNTMTFDKTTLKVKGLKVSSKTKTSVTLKWNKVSNADGYRIYKYNSSKKKYVEVKTVKASTLKYTIKSLKKNTSYKFAVKAYKKINGKTYWSSYTTIKVKTKSN